MFCTKQKVKKKKKKTKVLDFVKLDFVKLEYYKEVLDFRNIEYCITFLITQIPVLAVLRWRLTQELEFTELEY